jgi:tetratricopeptide (TPR) repeat protein
MPILASIVIAVAATSALTSAAGPTPSTQYPSEEALRRYAQGRLLEEGGSGVEALGEYYRALLLDGRALGVARRVSELSAHAGEPERSLEFAERALALDPGDPRALWLKGTALLNLERHAEAYSWLERAVARDSGRIEYVRTLARAAERLERLAVVARCWRRVVWLDEDDGEAWFQLAAAEARSGRFAAADSAMGTAMRVNPVRPGSFFLQGWIAENLGRRDDARMMYRQHLGIHGDDLATRRRLALLLVADRRFAEALLEARELARARPDDLEARHLEIELSFQSGAEQEGMKLLDRLAREHAGDARVVGMRVALLGGHGRGRQAVREAEAWLAQHPSEVQSLLLAARAHQTAGTLEPALRHLERAIELAPDSLAPRVLLARAYQSGKRWREAEAVWSAAAVRFPGIDGVAFDLALCRERLGDLPGAEAAVRDVLGREPDNPTALNFLGYLLADHNRKLEEALALIQRALAHEPDNGAFIDSLGWTFYRLGRLGEARLQLERAAQLTGGDPVVLEHLGDVYKDLRLKDLAREQYRRSLAADGSNARVRAKLSELR